MTYHHMTCAVPKFMRDTWPNIITRNKALPAMQASLVLNPTLSRSPITNSVGGMMKQIKVTSQSWNSGRPSKVTPAKSFLVSAANAGKISNRVRSVGNHMKAHRRSDHQIGNRKIPLQEPLLPVLGVERLNVRVEHSKAPSVTKRRERIPRRIILRAAVCGVSGLTRGSAMGDGNSVRRTSADRHPSVSRRSNEPICKSEVSNLKSDQT